MRDNTAGHAHYKLKVKFNELEKEKEQKYDVPNIARLVNETMTKRKNHKIKKDGEKKGDMGKTNSSEI